MAITREQVADLQPGDVVELRDTSWGGGAIVRGPLFGDAGELMCGPGVTIRYPGGAPGSTVGRTLTIVSRVPRPLYVNHPRTEPVAGDVVRDADNESDNTIWMLDFGVDTRGVWCPPTGVDSFSRAELPARLRLLVDGSTGQVVP